MDFYKPQNTKEILNFLKQSVKKITPEFLSIVFHSIFPTLSVLWYRNPSKEIKVIGITGTDGKSSTVGFVVDILKENGFKVGFSSSVYISDGDSVVEKSDKTTMPGRFFMQRFLRKLVLNGCDFAVIEVTSEGIKYLRHLFVDFDVVVCTNISSEHVNAHGGFEKYVLAKRKLFERVGLGKDKGIPKTMVVNGDEELLDSFLEFKADRKVRFGFARGAVLGKVVESDLYVNVLDVLGERIRMEYGGPFILPNVLAAVAVGHALGIPSLVWKRAMEKSAPPPGRFEVVSLNPFVIIDYGHTVRAVEALLSFIRERWDGRVVHAIGCGTGDDLKWKTPLIVEISEKYADITILTEGNYNQPIEKSLEEAKTYFKDKSKVLCIKNRKEAVKKALEIADKNSIVLLSEKGNNKYITGPFGRKMPYDEKETVLSLLKK